MGGVYLFYMVEKILKIMILRKKMNGIVKEIKRSKSQMGLGLESIGYVKTHETSVEPSVEMRVHIDNKVLVSNKTFCPNFEINVQCTNCS